MTAPPKTYPALRIVPGNAQHQGCREQQQDGFGFSKLAPPDDVLAIVADGMGGHLLGQESSYLAVNAFLDGWKTKPLEEATPDTLQRLLHTANETVRKYAGEHGQLNNAGTTVAAVVITHDQLHWIAVGDSRIYLYRDGETTLLTHDHVYANRLQQAVANGDLSPSEADHHPHRDALTSFVGAATLAEVDCNLRPYRLQAGDRLLLCSDGLYRGLSEAEIGKELARRDPQAAADALVARVLEQRYPQQDNITVVILACEADRFPFAHVLGRSYRRVPLWLRILILVGTVVAVGGYASSFLASPGSWFSSFVEKAPTPTTATPSAPENNPPMSEAPPHDQPNPLPTSEPKSIENQRMGHGPSNRYRSERR